ncbi:hypothetical protein MNBD_IGNAVI01-3146 [hydrothermal vent metagenome]|uniref:Uncharacterized protein n=1 Tax=hydrothermal vent metagenome TaxID=652676 RepID=A0A3B1CHV0_9ZZZZ
MKISNYILFVLTAIVPVYTRKDGDDKGLNSLMPTHENSSTTIDISHLESTQFNDVIEFYFKPSVNITISKVDVAMKNFTDILPGDSQTIYEKDQWSMMVGYQGVDVGQEWVFVISGKDSSNNKDYQITTKYVVNN